jgi:23S rRNA G2069 N7-methylase RlmK/C1962 C5-methylase RlmI
MGLAFHKDLVFLLSAADRRQRLFDFLSNKKTCYRLFHFESGWDLAIDKLGERLFFWGNKSLNDFTIEAYCDSLGLAPLFRERQNRGKQTGSQLVESQTWMAQENDLNYVLKSHVGFSQGIFLDQRANRALIKKLSKNKTVLNLFCYTGGFSVAAAKGLATQVLSVDTSATYLNWAKENFQSNQLKNAEWIQQDSLLFLKGAAKRQQKYDLIIIDPPSFSRGTKKIKPFKIEKDYKSLLDLSFKVLAPNGKIFFSTNFEKWSLEEFKKRVLSVCPQHCNFDWLAHEWDFELPPFEPKMKSVLISTQS